MPAIPEFVRKRQGDQEFNVIFSDVGKSRPACNVCPCSPLLSIVVINTVTQSRLGRKSLFGSHVPINVWFSFCQLDTNRRVWEEGPSGEEPPPSDCPVATCTLLASDGCVMARPL